MRRIQAKIAICCQAEKCTVKQKKTLHGKKRNKNLSFESFDRFARQSMTSFDGKDEKTRAHAQIMKIFYS